MEQSVFCNMAYQVDIIPYFLFNVKDFFARTGAGAGFCGTRREKRGRETKVKILLGFSAPLTLWILS